MNEPRRILYVRIDGCFGGPERHILCLFKHLNRSRYQPYLAPLVQEGKLAQDAREMGVPVTPVPMPSRLAVRSARGVLTSIIRDNSIDLVHTYGIRSNLVAGPLARKLGLPWVSRLPNLNYTDYANPYLGWFLHFLNNRLLSRADAVQVISAPLKEYVASLPRPPARIELIPNGIDLPSPADETTRKQARQFYQLVEDQIVIGSLGRVELIKGYDLLLYCLADLPRGCTILIGGEGSECDRLKQQAHVLGFADRFRLVGFVEDVRLFLAACDVYVQPSRSEGVPYALLEGMAMSLPVVATEVGGIGDVIRDGEDGILVPPEDRLMLRDRLMELCADKQMRQDLGQRARERIEQVGSADVMTGRIERLYGDLLEMRSKRRERSDNDGG
ncbi:MAG: glycosyltransferase family 4 protein [bacterium]